MAGTIRYIPKINLNAFMSNVTRQFFFGGNRKIYTDEALGLLSYKNKRDEYLSKYQQNGDTFLKQLKNIVQDPEKKIFTEDFKVLAHIVDKTPEKIQLLQDMVYKYSSQNTDMSLDSYKFGPTIMRTLYYLNEPNLAKTLFLNLYDFFNQVSSFTILLDLLYENQQYRDMREVFTLIIEKTSKDDKPRFKAFMKIIALACYKENTPESLDYALKICEKMHENGDIIFRHVLTIVSALALKQNKPGVALEMLYHCRRDNISVRSLRLMALADLNKIDDILIDLKTAIDRRYLGSNKYYFDVATKIEDAIKRQNIDEDSEFCKVYRSFKESDVFYMRWEDHILLRMTDEFTNRGKTRSYRNQNWNTDVAVSAKEAI